MSILPPVHHKYYLINTISMTWAGAKNYCRETYDDIATVGSDDDWIRLRKEETDKGLTTFAWVGLYDDIDSWRWSFNDVPLKNQTLTKWYSGEPDNGEGNEACGTIGQLGEWRDYPCTDLRPFICYNCELAKNLP
ncbi:C-type lectin domain family 4 member K-like [Pangasianodon hypophthalmus]|uniref:C-type lectin domain family 4 member K-like n=1 Tax=Pangasianodon hypophthalmus TaxID=310915 RepID=UPI0023082233|nr:C-type lectin domain family 4 member K-like [Pangasianodon hypophthalmus]